MPWRGHRSMAAALCLWVRSKLDGATRPGGARRVPPAAVAGGPAGAGSWRSRRCSRSPSAAPITPPAHAGKAGRPRWQSGDRARQAPRRRGRGQRVRHDGGHSGRVPRHEHCPQGRGRLHQARRRGARPRRSQELPGDLSAPLRRGHAPPRSPKNSSPPAPSRTQKCAPSSATCTRSNAPRARRRTATAATVPGGDSVGGNGTIPIPAGIPEVVQRVIAGANAITDFPYVYGGGHASFVNNSYDCSGSVSYALAAGGLLCAPETSGSLESWGEPGPGKWITIYANAGHVYMYVNVGGRWMRFDTVGRSGPYASRWQPEIRSNAGFVARHPAGAVAPPKGLRQARRRRQLSRCRSTVLITVVKSGFCAEALCAVRRSVSVTLCARRRCLAMLLMNLILTELLPALGGYQQRVADHQRLGRASRQVGGGRPGDPQMVGDGRFQQHFEAASHLLVDRVADNEAVLCDLLQRARYGCRCGDWAGGGGSGGGSARASRAARCCSHRRHRGPPLPRRGRRGRPHNRDRLGNAGGVAARVGDGQRDVIGTTVRVGMEDTRRAGAEPGRFGGDGGAPRRKAAETSGEPSPKFQV